MANRTRTNKRATAPRVVRQVARAASLNLRGLATSILDGQPSPPLRPDQAALLRWLTQSARSAQPDADGDKIARQAALRLNEMANAGDATARAALDAGIDEIGMNLARIEIAVAGA
jgi:hypothetical protein